MSDKLEKLGFKKGTPKDGVTLVFVGHEGAAVLREQADTSAREAREVSDEAPECGDARLDDTFGAKL